MSNMNDEHRSAPALANAVPRAIGRVGIIGAGTTGTGIAIELLDADVPVTLFDFAGDALGQGMALARAGYQDAVAQGALAPEKFDRRMALLAGTVYLHHLKDCDLIIDAACIDMAGRENLFRRLDQIAKPGAVLMTHAAHGAHVDIDRVAGGTRRAGEVLGWHVADPANANAGASMEFVCGKDTSAQALATVIALAALSHAAPLES